MLTYSSNGMTYEPRALKSGGTFYDGLFDPEGGRKISMEGEELRSAQQDILQRNAGSEHSAELMTNIGLGTLIVSGIILITAGSVGGLDGFLLALAALAGVVVFGAVLFGYGLHRSKEIKSLPRCIITAYSFKIKGKFYQEKTYPRGGKVTEYYVEFGNNIVHVNEQQYNSAKSGNELYCVTAQRDNTVYFALTGRL